MTPPNSSQGGEGEGSGAPAQARQPAGGASPLSPQAVSAEGAHQAQHTPGPWMVSPFYAGVTTAEFGKDGDFLPVAKLLWPTDERSEAETYANARLIAAAPDLLSALAGLLDLYTGLVNCGACGFWDCEGEDEVIAARDALSKARSEQGA